MPEDQAVTPIIERRRIEAELLKEVYETLKAKLGREAAQELIAESVRRSAIAQAAGFAASTPGGTSLQSFVDIQRHWTAGGALEIETVGRDATHFAFNVTRCRYAEMYRAMGLGEIGHLLSCQRDGAFCEGYDPKLKMERTQTIMGGASHCDFRYHYEEDAA
ncbi:L-2-amino-thiazoline-4-carboxylic acid hydrolase [Roseomonas mucosa]|uniref:2-amino-thiazoline-4-carboxylic acid hydrolase n=1 Tax=Roseomonas mucosa TaxID=207340 RepID=A0A1S8D0P6_9PROT|nr:MULTISPECIES: L-2-amino-thiazoline-4-carboxylic acid hydrolase [Roseomonas]MBS5903308.1 L-2-amino-thiazoline-4-carboxylic acid hydrolase [Acetobacteraceae bacterium]MDT8267780.1 L-2-amino-thiazoline-4-carboxylic acid hydrolase [Roseomonas sp. DSM 102946]ATR22247.1 2-amino-thiazoline-4-carboxylic acid hydrolase [Roseomonas sp. FDAARGOS_362]AWV20943.1 L-2-amino-thiazoline-4-carboxylic acid hydrolase [Roseomonas mucosa]MCG7354757.1 L-2-amino-thiazoline-4-carboxylic acid hydrolase [Roseomonas m